jgi:serine/threonine protein kinase
MDSTPEFLRAKYESVELIGEGGDGRVYKCQRGERVTAVKTLVALDLASQTRFLSEADILLQIDHENIVKVFEAGKTDGCFWYESEHANEGHFGTMHGYILQSDLDRANYFGQICLGVQALHNLNPPIIHRDLKPRNILVFSNAEPRKRTVLKIADFGLAVIAGEEGGLTTTGDALV